MAEERTWTKVARGTYNSFVSFFWMGVGLVGVIAALSTHAWIVLIVALCAFGYGAWFWIDLALAGALMTADRRTSSQNQQRASKEAVRSSVRWHERLAVAPLEPQTLREDRVLVMTTTEADILGSLQPRPLAAGWYPDPLENSRARLYNGTAWTGRLSERVHSSRESVPDEHIVPVPRTAPAKEATTAAPSDVVSTREAAVDQWTAANAEGVIDISALANLRVRMLTDGERFDLQFVDPPPTRGGYYADPLQEFDARFFNGAEWTGTIADHATS